jgi:hypothetical protein
MREMSCLTSRAPYKGDKFHPDWNYSVSPRGQIVEP